MLLKNPFELKHVIAEGKIITETRFYWWYRNFGGWTGWRKIMEKSMMEHSGSESIHIIGRFFGRLIFIDGSHKKFWKYPKYERTSGDGMCAGAGWLYWAIYITKEDWFPNPRRYMPGFKKLEYASEELAARYYLHDHEENTCQ